MKSSARFNHNQKNKKKRSKDYFEKFILIKPPSDKKILLLTYILLALTAFMAGVAYMSLRQQTQIPQGKPIVTVMEIVKKDYPKAIKAIDIRDVMDSLDFPIETYFTNEDIFCPGFPMGTEPPSEILMPLVKLETMGYTQKRIFTPQECEPQIDVIPLYDYGLLADPLSYFLQFCIANIGYNIIQIKDIEIDIIYEPSADIYEFFYTPLVAGGAEDWFVGREKILLNRKLKKIKVNNLMEMPRLGPNERMVCTLELVPVENALYKMLITVKWRNLSEPNNISHILTSDTASIIKNNFISWRTMSLKAKSLKVLLAGNNWSPTELFMYFSANKIKNIEIIINDTTISPAGLTIQFPENCKSMKVNYKSLIDYYHVNNTGDMRYIYRIGPIPEISSTPPEQFAIINDSIVILNSCLRGICILKDKPAVRKYSDMFERIKGNKKVTFTNDAECRDMYMKVFGP